MRSTSGFVSIDCVLIAFLLFTVYVSAECMSIANGNEIIVIAINLVRVAVDNLHHHDNRCYSIFRASMLTRHGEYIRKAGDR